MRRLHVFTLALAVLVAAGPLAAGDFPQTVAFRGEALDASGLPLAGSHDLTFRYFDGSGNELFAERLAGVTVASGAFTVELGTGRAAGHGRFASLEAVFAAHPEVQMEVAVDGIVQEPRLGILPAGHSLKSALVAAGVRPAQDNEVHWKGYESKSTATAFQSGILAPQGTRPQDPNVEGSVWRRPYTLPVIGPSLSPEVRSLPIARPKPLAADGVEINRPRHESLFDANGHRFGTTTERIDDYLANAPLTATRTPPLSASFEGINNVSGVLPPDTEMAVGPNHVVQVVNLVFAVYNKSGTLLAGPSNTNTLWAGFGGPCQTDNSGDPIFLYDRQADRFVLTQFAVAAGHRSVCFAVSQTSNPLGAYYRYEVVTPRFPDYFKVGTWPAANHNAYFFGTNSGFQSQYDVFAVDRQNMLLGLPARPMQFFQNFTNLMMPADADGPVGPGASSPGLIYNFKKGGEPYFGSPPTDRIDVYSFAVNWTTPASTTLTLTNTLTPAPFNWTVCGFFVQNCIPQPGTAQGLDSASWWPMQRLVYRNFGSHETLVGSWTVDVNVTPNRAAPRWFELRNTGGGWSIFQQGTHSPDAIHRWMPSVAMDGTGNIAIGYSRGDAANFASLYYATHETTDALGTMQAEAVLFAASGSQTHSAARWGDYSSMEIDPADDCTFWYTSEYLAATGSAPWRTRVGSFKLASCGGGGGNTPPVVAITAPANGSSFASGTSVTFTGTANDAQDGNLSAGLAWTSSINGAIGSGASFSTSALSVGSHTITASVTDSGGLPGSAAITVNITSTTPVTVTFTSIAAEDGRIPESGENTNVGGTANSNGTGTAALRVGDTNQDRQLRTILSFDTSSIPDTATVTAATVQLRRGSLTGTNPFGTHGSCQLAIVTGAFGGANALANADFQNAATVNNVGTLSNPAANGATSTSTLNAAGRAAINKTGRTQFRAAFTLDDNDDTGNDYIGFHSGNDATAANRPILVVTYTP